MKRTSSSSDDVLVMVGLKRKRRRLEVFGFLREEMVEFNTTIQEIKFAPVKFGHYFRMSAGQFGGAAPSTGSKIAEGEKKLPRAGR